MTANAPSEAISVQTICNILSRSRLVPPEQVRTLYQRWSNEARTQAGDVARFRQWLVANRYVTNYQAERLARGQTTHYFLGQYRLEDRIGQGRMAGVYKAIHSLGTVVAVKILPPSKTKDMQAFGRFQREARLARRLKHPNIVRTFQMGETEGLHYIVMEYLEGETLRDVLQRRSKLPPPEAARLVYQALMGLQHIHEQAMVHRDLEPGNLMLVPGWSQGRSDDTLQDTIKILDIGLGRALFDEEGAAGGDNNLTTDGTLLGKPEYMAPEQARNAHTSGIQADIYSLGCVLYHCLAGRPPFVEPQQVKLLVKHATTPPPPLKEFNPAVPDGLQQIIDWMLAKDPAKRYQTPERAAQALQVFLAASRNTTLQCPEADPTMQTYLQWLAANTPAEDVEPLAPPSPPPQPVPAPVPMPAPTPAQVSAPTPAWVAEPSSAPAQEVSAFAALDTSNEVKAPTLPRTESPMFRFFRAIGLSDRDVKMLGIGGVVVFVLILALWIALR